MRFTPGLTAQSCLGVGCHVQHLQEQNWVLLSLHGGLFGCSLCPLVDLPGPAEAGKAEAGRGRNWEIVGGNGSSSQPIIIPIFAHLLQYLLLRPLLKDLPSLARSEVAIALNTQRWKGLPALILQLWAEWNDYMQAAHSDVWMGDPESNPLLFYTEVIPTDVNGAFCQAFIFNIVIKIWNEVKVVQRDQTVYKFVNK